MWLKALTIAADLIEFSSFWLAAPELLGETRLQAVAEKIRKLEPIFPGMVMGLSGAFLGFLISITASRNPQSHPIQTGILLITILWIGGILLFSKKVGKLLAGKVAEPLFRRLSSNTDLRMKSLKMAAFLFCFSFLLKLMVDVVE